MSAPGSTGSPGGQGGTGAAAPPAAAAAAADRALRRHLDAEATAALAEALAARAGQPPLTDPVQPAEGADAGQPTDTWAAALRTATRRSVATALADSLAPPPAPPTPQPPQYTLTEWVEHIYANTFIRRLGQTQRWCASWWAHAEAIVRLEALWRTWEAAAASDNGAATAEWLRIYLDPLNGPLLGPDGPFSSCTPERHSESEPMWVTAPPAGYWREPED